MDDIRAPRKKPTVPPAPRPTQSPAPFPPEKKPLQITSPRRFRANWKWALGIFGGIVLIGTAALVTWYAWALQPLQPGSTEKIRITIASGDSSTMIANRLKESGVVRSASAVRVYSELSGAKSKLQAGGYTVSPGQSTPDIINHLVSGKTDELSITISPGITLIGIREQFRKYGYSDQEITTALNASYTSPLLADKPADATLEGYIFPETFRVNAGATLQSLFERSFDELYSRLQRDGLIEKFKQHGLNLHQAVTLASIVQKEVSNPVDEKQVAQVFYSRLAIDMPLESDVTFVYAAKLLGVEPSVTIDSPYNTRKYKGLPPGPIANMNYAALQAVADPAPGDYMYFVAGDDGKTYFSHTIDEHVVNVKKHCIELCE